MLYFAYGSNLDWQRIKERCPSVCFVCVAKLPGHRFAFTRKSKDLGCGVMDIISDTSSEVWGVVYQIDEKDVGHLDKAEGYRHGRPDGQNTYRRIETMVFEDGDEERPHTVYTYEVVSKSDQHISPNQKYKRFVVEGAKQWQLPPEYIAKLKAIKIE